MGNTLKAGIDIGSTTIKTVVLDDTNNVLYKSYARHFSAIGPALLENLNALERAAGGRGFLFALTGSAGMGTAQRMGLPFVQEVVACASAVKALIPRTDTVVELGGEDAKITYFGRAPEQRMNGVCAGGTGSFIDHMASLLSTDAGGLNALAEQGRRVYAIASRCGVFAKTDVQALMNDGAEKPDIALSIFQAVVNQTIGNLAQGRPICGRVAFLGGPLHFLPELKKRFVETLNLAPGDVVPVEDGCYFVAVGAALSDEAVMTDAGELCRRAAGCGARAEDGYVSNPPLFVDKAEYEAFRERHMRDRVRRGDAASYHGPVYVGIDAGSTTTKIAAVGADKELLYSSYGSNGGAPLAAAVRGLRELYGALGPGAHIAGAMATGYGEAIVRAAVHADSGEVETFAHLRAAREFRPDVSFVLDIGGQDMKCFFVRNGNIGNIMLNEACSAGCGSFIENFAQGLGMTAEEFAAKALDAEAPVDLGTRCTVFMNSRVKQAQKDGASVGGISAGIAGSVIRNALFKVMQLKDMSALGDSIVVQGGTFCSDAVLRSMELLTGKEVVRPDIAGLMGAYGAALLALEDGTAKSSLLSAEELGNFHAETSSFRCRCCGNQCLVTTQRFPDGGRYFTGNRCERGAGIVRTGRKTPNIYTFKYKRLFSYYKPRMDAPRGQIGIPRVLNIYEDYPFWFTFFTRLGYGVVLSSESSAELYGGGIATIPSDSLCYPAKLTHGHIADLINKGVRKIFYPCLPYNIKDKLLPTDNCFNCPVVASYAENIRANVDELREKKVCFMQPFLPSLDKTDRLVERLTQELSAEGIARGEIAAAVEAGQSELERYKNDVRHYGARILRKVEREGLSAVLLVGRPYHTDPWINHGVPEMIQSYGLPVISADAVCHAKTHDDRPGVVNQWCYHARLYHAAHYAAEHGNISLIQLSSFGCGLDAITTGVIRSILESKNRLYTMIKLDEISNLGAARIRLRSMMAAMARGEHAQCGTPPSQPERARFTKECKKNHTILAPQMAPIHFELLGRVLHKYGYDIEVPEMPSKPAIDLGLRYVNNDMCYPAIVVIGQMLAALKSGRYDTDRTSIMLFQTCGACRATNYLNLLRQAVRDAGFPQVPVFACWGIETDSFKLGPGCFTGALKAVIYGDLLMKVKNRVVPYETKEGSTQKLFREWMERCGMELEKGSLCRFWENLRGIIRDFDAIPIREGVWKPKVGIVGEILAKYHPVANGEIERTLADEGAEVIMPSFANFFLYLAYCEVGERRLLAGTRKREMLAWLFIRTLEFFRRPMIEALLKSRRFSPPHSIERVAKLAEKHVSLGNIAGEGWFLTGEMVQLIEDGVKNIVCLQPFACLPNHITGKGVVHELRGAYPGCNILPLDCDAGMSEVNQLNRIKLMLSVAKERGKQGSGEYCV